MNKVNKRFPLFISSEKIFVKQFIERWTNELSEELSWIDCDDLTKFNVFQMGRPHKFIKSLEESLNLDDFVNKLLKKDLNAIDDQWSDQMNQNKGKYRHEFINKTINIETRHLDQCNHKIPLALLTVQIFKPAIKHNSRVKLNLDREFQVLSCQPLSVLRDSYFCITDIIHQSDYSNDSFESLPRKPKNHEKMGFYLIDHTFYYDDRCSEESLESILHWAQSKMDHCSKKSMTESRFEDLQIQLGFPYLYMHRGNCEHLLVFTDISLFIPNVEDDVQNYPKSTVMEKINTIKCQMCNLYFAKWITLHNQRLPMSPFYFCHSCFLTFNYDENLKKIGSFKAFPLIVNINE